MRLRFSLRTFFILLTLLACSCYLWLTLPSNIAQRFADAVNNEDYQAADRLFVRSGDRFLAEWADRHWAFKARAKLRPLTLGQLLTARRHVDVDISYFELDHTASRHAQVTAMSMGVKSLSISSVRYGGMFIDRAQYPLPLQK